MKVGFACKFLHHNQTLPKKVLEDYQRPLTEKCTTVTWLNRQTVNVAEQRLWDIMEHNGAAALRLVQFVAAMPVKGRMVRLGSNQLPAYTHPDWRAFWQCKTVQDRAAALYAEVGAFARRNDVRLSMHPGQFVVLASDNPSIVDRSVEEFEYHADLIRWMGYGRQFQDFKCNVHISGRQGPDGIRAVLPKLSPEARNTITIENDENAWGLDATLQLATAVPLVLDIHHHFVNCGEYIRATDDRIKRIIDSWRGVRPVVHYSQSREEYLDQFPGRLPTFADLTAITKRGNLRAHSEYFKHTPTNDWAREHWDWADIMAECKGKNLAVNQLLKQWT